MCGLADEGDPGDFVVQLSKCRQVSINILKVFYLKNFLYFFKILFSGHMFHRDCVIACAKDEWM